MTEPRRTTLLFSAGLLALGAGLAPWTPASAATVQCGDVLTTDTTLTADLTCGAGGDALRVGADGVTLDLAGHTISGPGAYATAGSGVRVAQHTGVRITKGTITGFQSGVVLDESRGVVVEKLAVHHNDQGINLAGGGGHVVEKNEVFGNGRDGIRLGLSADNVVAKNTVTGNTFGIGVADGSSGNLVEKNDVARTTTQGIWVSGDSAGGSLTKNTVSTSGLDGIHVEGPATTITKNTSVDNAGLGIYAVPTAIDGGGNKASGNGNTAQCVGVVCR